MRAPAPAVIPVLALVLLVACATSAAAQNETGNATGNASESGNESASGDDASPYLEGTRDPSNTAWWYAALGLLALILVGALWFMGVLPR